MNDSTVVKEYRRAKLRAAASAIELAITAMEDLINDYDREHTKFSGCHPRQGHAKYVAADAANSQGIETGGRT